MKKNLLLLFCLGAMAPAYYFGQLKASLVDAKPNEVTTFKGNLNEGVKLDDLSWASRSSTACFPATQNAKFTGNHVLYYFDIPPYSEVDVTLIPDDKSANFSLYGYQVGITNTSTPPGLNSCISCEADHKWDYPKKGKTQDHTRGIFFNSIKNPYRIYVGVTGAEGLSEGSFKVQIDLKSKIDESDKQQPLKVYSATAEKGKTLAYAGDLADGVRIYDLSWAANSSVACFPATQNLKFNGNHVLFVTEIPKYSKMKITLIPDDKNANMSVYAYQDGTTSKAYPPNLNTCVSCEAEHKWDYPKKGKTQDHTRTVELNAINNPYRVVIGVAGADGLNTGGFKIQIAVE